MNKITTQEISIDQAKSIVDQAMSARKAAVEKRALDRLPAGRVTLVDVGASVIERFHHSCQITGPSSDVTYWLSFL